MLAWLQGRLVEKDNDLVVVNVNGVGYEVFISNYTLYALPQSGEEVVLFIHTVVREDAFLLYGFKEKIERLIFRTLTKVNGIGPRTALGMLSQTTPTALIEAIHFKDAAAITKLPGIGKKSAERIIIELGDKINRIVNEEGMAMDDVTKASSSSGSQDAIKALVALGYKENEASRVVRSLDNGALSSDHLIKEALKRLSLGLTEAVS